MSSSFCMRSWLYLLHFYTKQLMFYWLLVGFSLWPQTGPKLFLVFCKAYEILDHALSI
uniref:Uncharacterized protein n=1 Tax=Rhizophora mucronata TaxID=61149 RepID=A0A2P2KW08_RHIMU